MQKIMEKRNRLWPTLSRCWAVLLREIEMIFGRKHFTPKVQPMSNVKRLRLRIVFYKEDGDWVAHCLEFNLLGDGETKQQAMERLCEAIALQMQATAENKNPLNLFTPADGKFFEMFASGTDVAVAELHMEMNPPARRIENYEIEACEYREYIGGAAVGV